ncbi:unnamed protein product [Amoebophrya sp. A25]|nr:unnamed protein product [Amoebophrya sp. A25]|eukprot:GSA25T00002646001.1
MSSAATSSTSSIPADPSAATGAGESDNSTNTRPGNSSSSNAQLRDELTDPITLELLKDPVTLPCCGKAFSRSSIVNVYTKAKRRASRPNAAGNYDVDSDSDTSDDNEVGGGGGTSGNNDQHGPRGGGTSGDDEDGEVEDTSKFRCPSCRGLLGRNLADGSGHNWNPLLAAKNVTIAALVDMFIKKTGEVLEDSESDDQVEDRRTTPGAVPAVNVMAWTSHFTPVLSSRRAGDMQKLGSSATTLEGPPASSSTYITGELSIFLQSATFCLRPSLFIAVLDRSGSMGGKPYEQVLTATKHMWSMAQQAGSAVKLVLLSYGSDCIELTRPEDYRIAGGTDFRRAYEKIGQVLERFTCSVDPEFRDQPNNVSAVSIAFLTDGQDMSRDRSPAALCRDFEIMSLKNWRNKRENAEASISVHTIGFSSGCSQSVLEAMRKSGTIDGVFRYAEPGDDDDVLCGKVVEVFDTAATGSSVPLAVKLPPGSLECSPTTCATISSTTASSAPSNTGNVATTTSATSSNAILTTAATASSHVTRGSSSSLFVPPTRSSNTTASVRMGVDPKEKTGKARLWLRLPRAVIADAASLKIGISTPHSSPSSSSISANQEVGGGNREHEPSFTPVPIRVEPSSSATARSRSTSEQGRATTTGNPVDPASANEEVQLHDRLHQERQDVEEEDWRARRVCALRRWIASLLDGMASELMDIVTAGKSVTNASNQVTPSATIIRTMLQKKQMISKSGKLRILYSALFENRLRVLQREVDFLRKCGRSLTSSASSLLAGQDDDGGEDDIEGRGAPTTTIALDGYSEAVDVASLESVLEQLKMQIQDFKKGASVNAGKLGDLRFASKFAGKTAKAATETTGIKITTTTAVVPENTSRFQQLPVAPTREYGLGRYNRAVPGTGLGRNDVMDAIAGHALYRSAPESLKKILDPVTDSAKLLELIATPDANGNHALHLACYCGHKMVVVYLLEKLGQVVKAPAVIGNLINRTNVAGENCVTLAIKARGFTETLAVLLDAGGFIPRNRRRALEEFCVWNDFRRTAEMIRQCGEGEGIDDPASYYVDEKTDTAYLQLLFKRAVKRSAELWREAKKGNAYVRTEEVDASLPARDAVDDVEESLSVQQRFVASLPMDWVSILDIALHRKQWGMLSVLLEGKPPSKVLPSPGEGEGQVNDPVDAEQDEEEEDQDLEWLTTGVNGIFDSTPLEKMAEMVMTRCFPKKPDAPDEDQYLRLLKVMLNRFREGQVSQVGETRTLLDMKLYPINPLEWEPLLHVATKAGSSSHVLYLLDEEQADIEGVNWKGTTCLGVSAFLGYPCIVADLIARGANIHHRNNNNHTPLRACCFKGSTTGKGGTGRAEGSHRRDRTGAGGLKCAEELIANGADIYGSSSEDMDETSVVTACRNGSALVLELLLNYLTLDFVLTKAAIDGFSALMAAAEQDRAECIEIIYGTYKNVLDETTGRSIVLEQRTDDDNQIIASATALHIACYYGRKNAVETLARLGANLNSQDINGYTPLHIAVMQGKPEIVRMLLVAGADTYVTDKIGNRALAYARGDVDIREIFANPLLQPLMLLARQQSTAANGATNAGAASTMKSSGPTSSTAPTRSGTTGASSSSTNTTTSTSSGPSRDGVVTSTNLQQFKDLYVYSSEEKEIAHELILPRYSGIPLILSSAEALLGRSLVCPDLGSTPLIQAVQFGNIGYIEALRGLVAACCVASSVEVEALVTSNSTGSLSAGVILPSSGRSRQDPGLLLRDAFSRDADACGVTCQTWGKWAKNPRIVEALQLRVVQMPVEVDRSTAVAEELQEEDARTEVQLRRLEDARKADPRVAAQVLFLGPPPPLITDPKTLFDCGFLQILENTEKMSDIDRNRVEHDVLALAQLEALNARLSSFNERSEQVVNAPTILAIGEDEGTSSASSTGVVKKLEKSLGLVPELKALCGVDEGTGSTAASNQNKQLQVLFTDTRDQIFDALAKTRAIWHAKAYTIRRVASGTCDSLVLLSESVNKTVDDRNMKSGQEQGERDQVGAQAGTRTTTSPTSTTPRTMRRVTLTPLEIMAVCLYTANSKLSESLNNSLVTAAMTQDARPNTTTSSSTLVTSSSSSTPPTTTPVSMTPNLKNFAAVLYKVLEYKLPAYAGAECFLASSTIDRKLYQKGTRFTWPRFVSTTALWTVALDNVPSFASKTRKGTVFLIKTKRGGHCVQEHMLMDQTTPTKARSVQSFSEFSGDAEVIFLPNAEFLVTNWYHGDPIALGQPNIRGETFLIKHVDGERQNLSEMLESDKSLIIELTEV